MINPIAYSYWRRIKAKARSFEAVPASIKTDVEQVGRNEVTDNEITVAEFETLTGLKY